MKRPKSVLRSTILKAIKVEPLKGRSWVDDEDMDNPKCSVCMVGGTLRQAGLSNKQIYEFGDEMVSYGECTAHYLTPFEAAREVKEHLENRRYLHALSVKFERLFSYLGAGKRTRKILTKFVRQNFPKRIPLSPMK